ncbi:MAG: ribonuclease HII [Clostridia bacterium]|nr:ribonuclease HII [Clostridia bacterium]
MADLFKYENELLDQGYKLIAGMDEAGRGPLAGPVAAACCIPDLTVIFDEINDSKKLTPKKRERLFIDITDTSIAQSVVFIDEKTIDEINILNATKRAMNSALWSLLPTPDYLLTDAVKYDFGVPYKAIIHGDALSYSIAAASILAKVSRDKLMDEYAEKYPEYGFEKHKGYGTAYHIEMLKKYGPCPIHRQTFIKNFFQ